MSETDPTKPETGAAFRRGNRATGTATVVVACNLPQGLILQIYDKEEVSFYRDGHPVTEIQATLNLAAGQYALRGPVNQSSLAAIGRGDRLPDDYRMIRGKAPDTGYALTLDVPEDFWRKWVEDNAQSPLVLNKHVFAEATEARAVARSREYAEFRSGLQGLAQAGDYRVPTGRTIRKYDPKDMESDEQVGALQGA
jgi:hypothetical protein